MKLTKGCIQVHIMQAPLIVFTTKLYSLAIGKRQIEEKLVEFLVNISNMKFN